MDIFLEPSKEINVEFFNLTVRDSMAKKALFDEDCQDSGHGGGVNVPIAHTFKLNEKYAKKYEEQKRAAELRALEEKYSAKFKQYQKDGTVHHKGTSDLSDADTSEDISEQESSSDESDVVEDEQGAEWLATEVDQKLLETIKKIRNRDASIYEPTQKYYETDKLEKQAEVWRQVKKNQESGGISLEEYQLKLLKEGSFVLEDEEENKTAPSRSYNEEQEKLRQDMKQAFFKDGKGESDGDVDDFFNLKKSVSTGQPNVALQKLAEELVPVTGEGADEDEAGNKFLMDYLLNKSWIPRRKTENKKHVEESGDEKEEYLLDIESLLDDEKHLEEAEEFEQTMNLRFEMAEGAIRKDPIKKEVSLPVTLSSLEVSQLVGHSRDLPGVRREDETRKRQRAAKLERRRLEKAQELQDLRRLKNLKKLESAQKITHFCSVAGKTYFDMDIRELIDDDNEDFDPVKFDAKMNLLFNDNYYNEKETDPAAINQLVEQEEDFVDVDEQKGRDLPLNLELKQEQEFKQDRDYEKSYYDLHYEDKIHGFGGTRFKYQAVIPSTFGLAVEDILVAPESTLNKFVSLRKLAPYKRTDEQLEDVVKYGKKKNVRKFYHDIEKAVKDLTGEQESERGKDFKTQGEIKEENNFDERLNERKRRKRRKKSNKE